MCKNYKEVTLSALIVILTFFSPFLNNVNSQNSDWIKLLSLPVNLANQTALVVNQKLYVLGGSTNDDFSSIYVSQIKDDGSLGEWNVTNQLPYSTYYHSTFPFQDRVYLFGGTQYPPTNSVSYVKSAKVDSEGNLLSWDDELPFNKPLSLGTSWIENGLVFYSGGFTETNGTGMNSNNIFRWSKLDQDGHIDQQYGWHTLSLPKNMYGHSMIVYNHYVYLIGGNEYGDFSQNVYESNFDEDGNFGPWVELNNSKLLQPFFRGGAVLYGNKIILLGGMSTIKSDKIYYTEINPDGSLLPWVESTYRLPVSFCCGAVTSSGKNIYIIGGDTGPTFGNYSSDIYYLNIENIISVPSTPTPFPTPTSTPTPTPNQVLKNPVVIIPGIGASWNYGALVHGLTDVPDTEWRISSYVKVYDGLIKAFVDNGYVLGRDLFVYAYDWRRSVPETAFKLNSFISGTVQTGNYVGKKVNIIGHSMGGLVAAKYLQNFGSDNVNKVITLGTPFEGAVKTYKVWEGADLSDFSGYESLLIKFIVGINSSGLDSEVEEIHKYSPSLQGLLPNFEYLVNSKGQNIPYSTLKWQNNLVPGSLHWSGVSNWLTTVGGSGTQTLKTLKLKAPDWWDKLTDKWKDGEPIGFTQGDGDGSVLLPYSKPLNVQLSVTFANADHPGLISNPTSQVKILQMLGESTPGYLISQPDLNKVLIVTIASPGTFAVVDPQGNEDVPTDGVVIVDNPQKGKYSVKVISSAIGPYTLHVGRINGNDTLWEEFPGNFSSVGQVQTVKFDVDLSSKSLGGQPLVSAKNKLQIFGSIVEKSQLTKIQKKIIKLHIDFIGNLFDRLNNTKCKSGYQLTLGVLFQELNALEREVDKIGNSELKTNLRALINKIKLDIETDYEDKI